MSSGEHSGIEQRRRMEHARSDSVQLVDHVELARQLGEEGSIAEAAMQYRAALKDEGLSAEQLTEFAALLYDAGQYSTAMSYLRVAHNIEPRNADTLTLIGHVLEVHKRDKERALSFYRRALAVDDKHVGAHTAIGLLVGQSPLDLVDQAISHLMQAVQYAPNEFHTHFNLAVLLHLRTSQYQAAYHHYVAALTLDVTNADAHYYFARLCFFNFARVTLARQHLLEALLIDSEHVEARAMLGLICEEVEHDYAAAMGWYTEAAQLNSMIPETHAHMGRLLCRAGFVRRAQEALLTAIVLDERDAMSLNNMAVTLAPHSPEQAMHYLKAAWQINKNSSIISFNMGMVNRVLADRAPLGDRPVEAQEERQRTLLELALRQFREAEELSMPDGETAACIAETTLRLDPENMDAIEKLYSRALNMSPQLGWVTHSMALVLYGKGRFHESLELSHAAFQTSPSDPRAARTIARILIHVYQRRDEALPYLHAAIALDPHHFETMVQLIMLHVDDDDIVTAALYAQKLSHAHPLSETAADLLALLCALRDML